MLFGKECKKVVCSLTFLLYAVTIIAMYISQFGEQLEAPVTPPVEGAESYGTIEKEVPEVLMPAATEGLVAEYMNGYYIAYPFGFYKEVKLKESDQAKMATIIGELTGGVTYERFRELMRQADELIGGSSRYSDRYLISNFSQIAMTYEDALAEYEEFIKGNNLTEGYTRLYCDYLGIVLTIMPVFVCVGLWQLDKRANMQQLIYSRRVSSAKLIVTRYLALTGCMVLPVVLTFVHACVRVNSLYPELKLNFGSAVGLWALWLLPAIMVVTALGALISEVVSPLLAIFVQGVWWYATLERNELTGDITKWTLILRHNTLGKMELFQAEYPDFIWNRAGYLLFSVLLVAITVVVYERKRKGENLRERVK